MNHILKDSEATRRYYDSYYLEGHRGYFTKERTQEEIYFLIDELGYFPESVCDVACGQGRHLLEFKKDGLKKGFGFDQSEILVKAAQKSVGEKGFKIVQSSFNDWQPEPESANISYCLFAAFGHVESENQAADLVSKMAKATKRGGIVCIDIDNVFDLLLYLDNRRKIKINGRSEFLFDATDLTLTHRKRRGETILDFKVRFFTAPQFKSYFLQAGFKPENIWFKGDFDGSDYTVQSKRIIALARKE